MKLLQLAYFSHFLLCSKKSYVIIVFLLGDLHQLFVLANFVNRPMSSSTVKTVLQDKDYATSCLKLLKLLPTQMTVLL